MASMTCCIAHAPTPAVHAPATNELPQPRNASIATNNAHRMRNPCVFHLHACRGMYWSDSPNNSMSVLQVSIAAHVRMREATAIRLNDHRMHPAQPCPQHASIRARASFAQPSAGNLSGRSDQAESAPGNKPTAAHGRASASFPATGAASASTQTVLCTVGDSTSWTSPLSATTSRHTGHVLRCTSAPRMHSS